MTEKTQQIIDGFMQQHEMEENKYLGIRPYKRGRKGPPASAYNYPIYKELKDVIICSDLSKICPRRWDELEIDFDDKNKRYSSILNSNIIKVTNEHNYDLVKNSDINIALPYNGVLHQKLSSELKNYINEYAFIQISRRIMMDCWYNEEYDINTSDKNEAIQFIITYCKESISKYGLDSLIKDYKKYNFDLSQFIDNNKYKEEFIEKTSSHNIKMISNCIEKFADNNDIKLEQNAVDNEYGNISINVSTSIDISYIGNLYHTLELLSGAHFSDLDLYIPKEIKKQGYNESDIISFKISLDNILEGDITWLRYYLYERCDSKLIDELLSKIQKMTNLGFEFIELTYSQDQYEKFIKKQQNLYKKGIYDINILNSQLKEYQFELEKIRGFIQTVPQIDEISKDIMNSKGIDECVFILESKYSLTKNQAQYISDLNLNEFDESHLKRYKIDEEELLTKINEVEELIFRAKEL